MSKGFENLADTLIASGTHPDTIYAKLAAHMDKQGVPLVSFRRYGDRPEIVRLFGERGVTTVKPDELATLAPLIRATYRPGATPLDGYLPAAVLADATCPTCEAVAENCSAHISDCPVYQAKKAAGVTS